ncbi:hypothetical protein HYU11_01360 [Candidatus Woesearchaeota archaeon]|nr:hypothetical protein [Candidatus Woesearchaeota archaeon]
MDSKEYLKNWTVNYARFRAEVHKGKIETVQGTTTAFLKDKKVIYVPMISVNDFARAADNSTIVTFNTKENLKSLTEKWGNLAEKKLTLIMVNPFSKPEEKWIIVPHVHEKICDKASLRQGLKTMHETAGAVSEDQISRL